MKLFHVLFVLGFVMGSFSFAAVRHGRGGADGAGGDVGLGNIAWFNGTRPIWYCIETAADFGLSADRAESEFLQAVKTWSDYLSSHASSQNFYDLRYQKSPKCGGWEDFTVYFGVENSAVETARQKYVAPLAFVERTEYSIQDGWGKGFMWIAKGGATIVPGATAPDWGKPNRLQAILRHEVGHILGCDHADGTIMDAGQAGQMLDRKPFVHSDRRFVYLAGIDHYHQLLLNIMDENRYVGMFGDQVTGAQTFERFVGRKPSGTVSATFAVSGLRVGKGGFDSNLTVSDAIGAASLDISFSDLQSIFYMGDLFRLATANSSGTFYSVMGRVGFGTTKAADGTKHNIVLSQNSDGASPVRLDYFWQGQNIQLFETLIDAF